jgi:site-specific recombinase XerD
VSTSKGRKLDVHAMRHCFATRLARSGAPLVQAQQLLGHSDPNLTARVYSHLGLEDLRRAVERINAEAKSVNAVSSRSA